MFSLAPCIFSGIILVEGETVSEDRAKGSSQAKMLGEIGVISIRFRKKKYSIFFGVRYLSIRRTQWELSEAEATFLGKAFEKAIDYNVWFKMLDLYALFLTKTATEKKSQKKTNIVLLSLFIIKSHKPKVQPQNWKTSKLDFCKPSAANYNRTHSIGWFSPNMPKGMDINIYLIREEISSLSYMKKKVKPIESSKHNLKTIRSCPG